MSLKLFKLIYCNIGSWWVCIQCYTDSWKWKIIQSDKDRTMDFH